MSAFTPPTCKVLKDNLANYSLLEIIHHEVGNGIAVITGYTELLQRLDAAQKRRGTDQDVERYLEKRESYLQTLVQREAQLNGFLARIRNLALYPPSTRFHQNVLKTNLIPLLKNVTDRLLPLFKDREVQVHYPTNPMYAMCDPPWIEFVFDHFINHNMAFHEGPAPIEVDLVRCSSSPCEIQVGIHINMRSPKRRPVAEDDVFGQWSQTLDQRDQDVCIALCVDILRQHGGRAWTETGEGNEFWMYASLPFCEPETH